MAALLVGSACSGDGGGAEAPDEQTGDTLGSPPDPTPAPAEMLAAIEDDGGGPRCDPLDPRACLLPFPSNRFTVDSPDTDTGRLVAFPEAGMPSNEDGVVADPTEWNRNDGFSPGTALLTVAPDVDLEASGLPGITDVPDSLAEDSPVVVIDADTGDRWPVWAELDDGVEAGEDRLLYVRPGVNFLEGHRYVVGLRNLVDCRGHHPRAVARLPGPPREPHHRPPRDRGRAGGHGGRVRHAQRSRRGPRGPLPGVGLHDRQRAQPVRAAPAHPGRRLRRSGGGGARVRRDRCRRGP